MQAQLRKWGNSLGVLLSIKQLRQLGLKEGDQIEIEVKGKKRLDGFGIAKGTKPFEREDISDEEFW